MRVPRPLSRLSGYAPGGLLQPFDLDLLAEFGLTPDDFVPELWRRGEYDGEVYAVPLDTHPFIVFYNAPERARPRTHPRRPPVRPPTRR